MLGKTNTCVTFLSNINLFYCSNIKCMIYNSAYKIRLLGLFMEVKSTKVLVFYKQIYSVRETVRNCSSTLPFDLDGNVDHTQATQIVNQLVSLYILNKYNLHSTDIPLSVGMCA